MPTFLVEEPAARWIPPVVWPKHSCDPKIMDDMLDMVRSVCADMDPRLWLSVDEDGTRRPGCNAFKTRMERFVADSSPMTKEFFLSRVGLFLATVSVYGLPSNGGRRLQAIRNRRAMLRLFLKMRFGLNVAAIDALLENADPPIEPATRREFPSVAGPVLEPPRRGPPPASVKRTSVLRSVARDHADDSSCDTCDARREATGGCDGDTGGGPPDPLGSRKRPIDLDGGADVATPVRRSTRRRVYRVVFEDKDEEKEDGADK